MLRSIQELKEVLSSSERQTRDISIVGSKDSGVTSIKNFLFRNFGVQSEGDLKIQDLENGSISLLYEKNIVNIRNEYTLFDKEGIVVIIDATNKQIDQQYLTGLIRESKKLKLKIVWFLNKIDKAIFEVKNPEELYQLLVEKIDQINLVIEQLNEEESFSEELDPTKNNVLLGSALDGWAFSLEQFSKEYAQKFKLEESKMTSRLWGENFYNHATKQWQISTDSTSQAERGFCTFVINPIFKIYHCVRQGNQEAVEQIVKGLGIKVDITNKTGRALLRLVMYSWMNSAKALLLAVLTSVSGFSEGLSQLSRSQIFSQQLHSQNDQKEASILYVFEGENHQIQAKILQKGENSPLNSKWNVFSSDLFEGQQIRGDLTVKNISHFFYSGNSIKIDWENVKQGDLIWLETDQNFASAIVTDDNKISFFKLYEPHNISPILSIEGKVPFSISNFLVGTISLISQPLANILQLKNESFSQKEELFDCLKKGHLFTQEDIEAILNSQNGCLFLNYSSHKYDSILSTIFSKIVKQGKIYKVRIEIETVNENFQIEEAKLEESLKNELKQFIKK